MKRCVNVHEKYECTQFLVSEDAPCCNPTAHRTSVTSTSTHANLGLSKCAADIASDEILAAVPSRKMHDPRGTGLVEVCKISVLCSTLLKSYEMMFLGTLFA